MRGPAGRMTNGVAMAVAGAFLGALIGGLNDLLAIMAGFIPARVMHPGLLDHAGLPVGAVPAWLTPLSSAFIHEGWLHISFNLVALLYCGRQVEEVLGPRLLLVLLALGAYAAAAGQWVLAPGSVVPMIGASGPISAIIGAYALLYSRQEVRAWGPIPAHIVRMIWLGAGWTAIQGMIAVAGVEAGPGQGIDLSRIAVGAHIGGFLAGMLLTRPLLRLRFGMAETDLPGTGRP